MKTFGDARVSTDEQIIALHLNALRAASYTQIFEDLACGRTATDPGWPLTVASGQRTRRLGTLYTSIRAQSCARVLTSQLNRSVSAETGTNLKGSSFRQALLPLAPGVR